MKVTTKSISYSDGRLIVLAGLGPDTVKIHITYMLFSGIIYFGLLLLISKCHHVTYVLATFPFPSTESNLKVLNFLRSKNRESNCPGVLHDEDVREMRQQVDNVVKQPEILKSYSLLCDRISKTYSDQTAVNCLSFKLGP